MLPKVSVIIPYNKDRGHLMEAINSFHAQDYRGESELILSHSQGTVGFNINRGLEKATGKYVKYFAEDDFLMTNCISESVNCLEENNAQWMHAKARNFYPTIKEQYIYKPFHKVPTFQQMLESNHIHGGTVMYRTDLLRQFPFDESLNTGEEYDVYLRLYKAGILPVYLDKVIFNHRRWEGQKSLGNTDANYQRQRHIVIKSIQNRYR